MGRSSQQGRSRPSFYSSPMAARLGPRQWKLCGSQRSSSIFPELWGLGLLPVGSNIGKELEKLEDDTPVEAGQTFLQKEGEDSDSLASWKTAPRCGLGTWDMRGRQGTPCADRGGQVGGPTSQWLASARRLFPRAHSNTCDGSCHSPRDPDFVIFQLSWIPWVTRNFPCTWAGVCVLYEPCFHGK